MASPRIAPPDPDEVAPEVAGLVALTAPPGREPPGTIAVLAHCPSLLEPFLGWAAALALHGALAKREHEILALRTAANCRSAFEWAEHAEFARAAGLTDDEIAGIAGAAHAWSDDDAALLAAADELHRDDAVSDETWAALRRRYGPGELVEVLYVVGQYTMLSMVANGVGLDAP